jgi:hypothetical protein
MKVGMDAVIAADFPIEFAGGAAQKSFALQSCMSIRAGQPPNTNKTYDVAPKPMAIKTKTSSSMQGVPLVAGFIPVDQQTFGRSHSKPLPIDGESVTLKVSLTELLEDTAQGKYSISDAQNGYIEFRAIQPDQTHYDEPRVNKNEIIFRIKVDDGGKISNKPPELASTIRPWSQVGDAPVPPHLMAALQNIDPDNLFDVEYKLPGPHQDFQDLKVASIDEYPVTGDADLLSVAVPLEMERAGHGRVYNATVPSQLEALTGDFIELLYKVSGEQMTMEQFENVQNDVREFAQNTGCITSYQLLAVVAVNDSFASKMSIFRALFQHGPETNNPGAPSDLNSDMLHFYKGMPLLTENENELVAFIMQPGFLEEHYYPVHPGWNMEKWAPVIEKQLELNQIDLINPQTLQAFDSFKRWEMSPPKDQDDHQRHVRYEQGANLLRREMDTMAKTMGELGVTDTRYVASPGEFSIGGSPPANRVPQAQALADTRVEESTPRMRH